LVWQTSAELRPQNASVSSIPFASFDLRSHVHLIAQAAERKPRKYAGAQAGSLKSICSTGFVWMVVSYPNGSQKIWLI
jgi:hypothetical protein